MVTKPTHGMIMGSHLLVTTSSGTVDASLGTLALRDKHATSFTEGQQVEMKGVMKTIMSKQVFLARTVQANGKTYTIRNQHGYQVNPRAAERASQSTTQKGEAL